MVGNALIIHIIRAGSDISYSSLEIIGNRISDSSRGTIKEFKLARHKAPIVDSIDAYFLTKILHQEYEGHVLGITDADLKTNDEDEFYNSIYPFGKSEIDKSLLSGVRICHDFSI